MRAVIAVIGKDMVGILANVSQKMCRVRHQCYRGNTVRSAGYVCNDYDGRHE